MENEFITVKEIKEVIRILENLEFETIFEEAHFTEAKVDYKDSERLLKVLETQLLRFQGGFNSIVDFNHRLDEITQGIRVAREPEIPNNEKLNTLLTTCGVARDKFLSFLSVFMARFSQLKGIDKQLKSVKDCYESTKHLSSDTKNSSDEEQIDGVLRKIAAYAFVVVKYCQFAYNLCTFVGLCDRLTGYYFKSCCKESLINLLQNEKGYDKDTPIFDNTNLQLLRAAFYAKNSFEIYQATQQIRADIQSRARNIA